MVRKKTNGPIAEISIEDRLFLLLPETNSSHLNMDGWNTIVSFWEFGYFQGRTFSFNRRFINKTEGIGFTSSDFELRKLQLELQTSARD